MVNRQGSRNDKRIWRVFTELARWLAKRICLHWILPYRQGLKHCIPSRRTNCDSSASVAPIIKTWNKPLNSRCARLLRIDARSVATRAKLWTPHERFHRQVRARQAWTGTSYLSGCIIRRKKKAMRNSVHTSSISWICIALPSLYNGSHLSFHSCILHTNLISPHLSFPIYPHPSITSISLFLISTARLTSVHCPASNKTTPPIAFLFDRQTAHQQSTSNTFSIEPFPEGIA